MMYIDAATMYFDEDLTCFHRSYIIGFCVFMCVTCHNPHRSVVVASAADSDSVYERKNLWAVGCLFFLSGYSGNYSTEVGGYSFVDSFNDVF